MKRFCKIAMLMLLLILTVCTVVACGSDGATEISVKEDGMPQLLYIKGKDLDLSNGVLVVKSGEEVTEIPLTSEGVTVTGFDKNTVGEQIITITYQGLTTQLTVKVVERMQAVEYVTDYLVGDVFDISKGRLKITRDDGTTYTVVLSDAKVTVSGFDSSVAGVKTLTATYAAGSTTYTATFNANVYAVDSVKLVAPTKKTYNSHEGGLSLAGGYLEIKANGGALSRDVALTAEGVTVSGFDLGAVNEGNTPLKQTVNVNYGGKSYPFEIELTYTDISLFKKNAAEFMAFHWNGTEAPEIPAEKGALALRMMAMYLDMSKAEQTAITEEECMSVARAAATYGEKALDTALANYSNAFGSQGGYLALYCKSYQDVKNAKDRLAAKTDDALYTVTPVLQKMAETFKGKVILGDKTFDSVAVLDAKAYTDLVAIFDHMLQLADKLDLIPANWEEQGVNNFAATIGEIYYMINGADYKDSTLSQIYYSVSAWRDADDAFDILYAYYFGQGDSDAVSTLATIRLPEELQELYAYVVYAMNEMSKISDISETSITNDTSTLLFYYYKALAASKDIKANGSEIIKNLYNTLSLNRLMGMTNSSTVFTFDKTLEYILTGEYGVQYFSSSLLGITQYQEMLDLYGEMLTKLFTMDANGGLVVSSEYKNSEEFNQTLDDLFARYIALSPTQQKNFLGVLNAWYMIGIPNLSFDASAEDVAFSCLLTKLWNDRYMGLFTTDAGKTAYQNLVIAAEIYAQRASYENWLELFKTKMDSVMTAYSETLNAADKLTFEAYLMTMYNKYVAIRARFNVGTDSTIDLGEWQEKFDAIEDAAINIDNANYLITQGGYTMFNALYSAYERMERLVNELLNDPAVPAYVKDAFYHAELFKVQEQDENGNAVTTAMTYDYVTGYYREVFIQHLLGYTGGGYVYDLYTESDLGSFLEVSYDLMWTFMWEYAFADGNQPTEPVIDPVTALAAIKAFSNMDVEDQLTFLYLEGLVIENTYQGVYHYAVDAFITERFTAKADSVIQKMFKIEQDHVYFANGDNSAESLEALENSLAALEAEYNLLSGEDKTSFAELEEVYAIIIGRVKAAIEAAQTPAA